MLTQTTRDSLDCNLKDDWISRSRVCCRLVRSSVVCVDDEKTGRAYCTLGSLERKLVCNAEIVVEQVKFRPVRTENPVSMRADLNLRLFFFFEYTNIAVA
ncbi:hypothetical protein NDU88_001507 [Pleurodeles waltl]|uniref:Uncharacterized protein n=1 Tax=Pleurodeles waltl TaxID=8319 RepID=A0AAV7P854_PLEWA|nr:hypothetical protein NDU88_001507 [Pleurodeles waltl]